LFTEENVKEFKKEVAGKELQKNLKRGKCIHRSCCLQRLKHKKIQNY